MSTKTKILLIGGTGYIGGAVLTKLIQHPDFDKYEITAYVRSEKKAGKLEQFGVKTALGTLQDTDKLQSLASKVDVVVACADADDLPAAEAILKGMAKRHECTGEVPVLIHTSGTGVFSDNAAGMHPTSAIYFDSDAQQIASLSPSQPHRNVDLEITDADAKGIIKSYIVLPSSIWGLASGPLVDAGIMNRHSLQIPMLIKASLDRGQAGMVGEGKNLWPYVDIHEVADLYITIFNNVLAGQPIGHGRNGYYIGENGEHDLYSISETIGKVLVELGKANDDRVTTFSKAELDKYFGGSDYLGSNSRCRAERSRSIGWQPVKTTKDMLASIKPEVESIIEHPEELKV